MNPLKIIVTEDGSPSLYSAELNETYHSFHGAVQESRHVFIKEGLDFFANKTKREKISVLEVGFGTGLNAILTAEWARERQVKVNYTTLEPFPLEEALFTQLNYSNFFIDSTVQSRYLNLHHVAWGQQIELDSVFSILKLKQKLQAFESEDQFDIVFFDAFAPNKQSELWELETLGKTVGYLSKGGVLVTYCAKGQLKRDLALLNLEVETLPGPPGKKEMVRAIKV